MSQLQLPECMRLLPEETMGVMRRLEWLARKRMQGTLTGKHTSPDKGISVEFAEHRPYAPGDDPRTLDWRVMARSDRNVVRQYIEETNLRATLAVDVSGSMAYTGAKAATLEGKALSKLAYAKYLAAALAYRQGIAHLIGGMCETDYSGYPDCRAATLTALQTAVNLGMDADFTFHTPLMKLDKAETWRLAETLGGGDLVALIQQDTHTCYLGERGESHAWGYGCGTCPACVLRRKGYEAYAAR